MTSETTLQTSCNQEIAEADECSENIPPEATTDMSKLQVCGTFSAQTNRENKPLSESCPSSTPAPTNNNNSGGKKKSRMSGLQSALTPFLKYLNIGNKCPSPEPSSCGSSPQPGSPSFLGGRSSGDKVSPVDWIHDEDLPEITLLDCTHDSTMQTTHTEAHATPRMPPPNRSKHNFTGTDLSFPDTPSMKIEPERFMDDRFFPEITLLDVTRDPELSPATPEVFPMDVMQEIPPVDGVEHSASVAAEPDKPDVMQTEELSTSLTGSIAHTTSSFSEQSKCALEDVKSLEATWDISTGGNNTENVKSEETFDVQAANVTHNLSSASSASTVSQPSDVQSNTGLKNLTTDIHVEPMDTSNYSDTGDKETPPIKEMTAPQRSQDVSGSGNGTFTVDPSADVSASPKLNTTDPATCPQNKTIDISPTDAESSKAGSGAPDHVTADAKNTTETSLDQNSSATMSGSSCDLQNGTFDIHSLQKSSGGGSTLGEASLQNNTFDCKPVCKQNGTITLSEASMSSGQQNTFTKPSPSKAYNQTFSPKEKTFDVHAPQESKQDESTDIKIVVTREGTFNANPDVVSAAGGDETKDHSQSKTNRLSEGLSRWSVEVESNKAHMNNLDESLDLKEPLFISTPMPHTKEFNFSIERDNSKAMAAQRRLYGDRGAKPDVQAPAAVPSNIISDRKTFLSQPAPKSLHPPLKSQLLKYKPSSSALPVKSEASRLPMTRLRAHTEALKNPAPAHAPHGSMGSIYNLRATTTALKPPSSGLPKSQLNGNPPAAMRSLSGLRPPSTKNTTGPAATNPGSKKHPLSKAETLPAKRKKTDAAAPASVAAPANAAVPAKAAAPSRAAAPASAAAPVKTAAPARADAASRAAAPQRAAAAAAAASVAAAAGRARALKPPVNSPKTQAAETQAHGCAKCVALEEQLRLQCEEIKRLNEELQKYSKQGEDGTCQT